MFLGKNLGIRAKELRERELKESEEKKECIAFCNECGLKSSEWLSDIKKCPECDGIMVFKSLHKHVIESNMCPETCRDCGELLV